MSPIATRHMVCAMPLTLRVAVGLLWAQLVGLLGLLVYFIVLVIGETTSLGIYVILFGGGPPGAAARSRLSFCSWRRCIT